MKIQLSNSRTIGESFPYGNYSKENRAFLQNALAQNPEQIYDDVVRHNINYYKLQDGNLVHIYNALEVA